MLGTREGSPNPNLVGEDSKKMRELITSTTHTPTHTHAHPPHTHMHPCLHACTHTHELILPHDARRREKLGALYSTVSNRTNPPCDSRRREKVGALYSTVSN